MEVTDQPSKTPTHSSPTSYTIYDNKMAGYDMVTVAVKGLTGLFLRIGNNILRYFQKKK